MSKYALRFHRNGLFLSICAYISPQHRRRFLRCGDPPACDTASYRIARVADDDSLESVGTVAGLAPDADGFVALYFDSSKLTRGRYQLTIGGDADTDAANAVSRFSIKLLPPTTSP